MKNGLSVDFIALLKGVFRGSSSSLFTKQKYRWFQAWGSTPLPKTRAEVEVLFKKLELAPPDICYSTLEIVFER